VHLDFKKRGRIGHFGHRIYGNARTRVTGIGWECVHVAIDDHSRLTYAEVLPDERGETTGAFSYARSPTRWHERIGTNAEGRWRLRRQLRRQLRATGLRPSRGWRWGAA
jgi:hypothetical protein